MNIPFLDSIQTIAKTKKADVYCVGGFLRDTLINTPKNDFDFAVSQDALKFARSFAKKVGGKYILLDEDHCCARIAKKIKDELYTYDFADYRAKTLKGDLSRRDFTVNTFALNITNLSDTAEWKKDLISHRSAQKDLKTKTVRMVGKNAFKEDPLRILRAFALMATHNFKIEKTTQDQIKKDAKLLNNVSYERITAELFKILESDKCYTIVRLMNRLGVLGQIIPQIKIMFGCTQGAYHHLDVWKHSLEALKQFDLILKEKATDQELMDYLNETIAGDRRRKGLIKLALLLHDIGKPDTRRKRPEGGYSFHGHENVGRQISFHVAKLLRLSTKERHLLEDMVQMHLRPGYISNFKRPSAKMLLRYFRDTKDEAGSIALISLADQRATRGPLTTEEDQTHHQKICERLIRDFFAKRDEKPFVPLLKGKDLIRELKLKPSPLFGKILKSVEEEQVLGKITTKAEAVRLAKGYTKK